MFSMEIGPTYKEGQHSPVKPYIQKPALTIHKPDSLNSKIDIICKKCMYKDIIV